MSDIEIDYAASPYEESVEEQIVFADSYNAFERVSGFDDEGWKDMSLFRQADGPRLFTTPEEIFRTEVQQILTFQDIDLNKRDKRTIVGKIDSINWLRFKVPLIYVLGYYVYKHDFSRNSIDYTLGFVDKGTEEKYEIIKSARHWKWILGY